MTSIAIVDSGNTHCDADWRSAGWFHEPMHKLYLVESGSGAYAIPGHELRLVPGRLYLIPGGRRHRYGPGRDLEVRWLHLRVLAPAIERRLARCERIHQWPAAQWEWWREAWNSIGTVQDLAGELRLQALAAAVLAKALTGQAVDDGLDPRLDAALRWMDAQCLRHPSLAEAARIAGLAPTVFHRRFSAAIGCTPRHWLEARRLDHARRMLREPGIAVQEVAAACGYANPFHFSRVIHRRLGVSPSELRTLRGP